MQVSATEQVELTENVMHSDSPEAKNRAIQIASNCNSGRFVVLIRKQKTLSNQTLNLL